MTTTSIAWIIDNGKREPETEYRACSPCGPIWVTDKMEALHFCRREDADHVAGEDEFAFIREHSITDDSPSGLPDPTRSDGDSLQCPWCDQMMFNLDSWTFDSDEPCDCDCEFCQRPITMTMHLSLRYRCVARVVG